MVSFVERFCHPRKQTSHESYLPLTKHGEVPTVLILINLKCLSIGTTKIINFPFVSNGKLMVFRCPNIQTHYNEAVLCLNFGTP